MTEQPRRRRRGRLVGGILVGALALAAVGFLAPTAWVRAESAARLQPAQTVAPEPVAIVFGAEVQPDGEPSAFLRARLEIAQRLYEAGTVKVILVSGDNGTVHYNEPDNMKRWLVARGVPERKVVADYAGFDTYDTCVRAKRIFGVERAILVSQTYHLYRAVAVCRAVGIEAFGVGDASMRAAFPATWRYGELRELLANVKAASDVLTRRTPTLGPRETGVQDALRDA